MSGHLRYLKALVWCLALGFLATSLACGEAAGLASHASGSDASRVRLALMGDPACLSLVDLLTARLSENSGYQLIERVQIDRVLGEQQLGAAGKAGRYLAMGRLLDAQAMMVISEEALQGRTNVVWRLVATGPGVVVASGIHQHAGLDAEAWLKAVQDRLARVKDKVLVPAGNAVPISLTRISYSSAVKDSDIQERTFNHLLRQRLMAEPCLFVLERWRLDEVEWEKTLAHEQQAFWTGGYVMEGQLEADPGVPENLTLNLSLKSASKQHAVSLSLKVKPDDWAGAVDRIVPWVAEVTAASRSGSAWSAAAEAELFHAEALAAEHSGLFAEAREFIEAACALGRPGVKMQKDRIRIYCRLLDDGEFTQLSGGFSAPLVGLTPLTTDTRASYSPERVKLAVRLVELYLSLMEHPPREPKPSSTVELLFFIAPSRVLGEVYDSGDSRLYDDPSVIALRQQLRAASQVYERIAKGVPSLQYYYFIKGTYGPLWMETPEEGATLLRQTFEAYSRCRTQNDWMYTVHFKNCRGFAAWQARDKGREGSVMQRLAAEFQQSTQCQVRLAGRILQYKSAGNEQQQRRMLEEEPEALMGSRGDDIIRSINGHASELSMGRYFLDSYAGHRPVPLGFMTRLLDHCTRDDVTDIYQYTMPRSRPGGLSAADKAQLRPAVENFLARADSSATTFKEKDRVYEWAVKFRQLDPLIHRSVPNLDELRIAKPGEYPGGGQFRGMFWDNGRIFAVTGAASPSLFEIMPEGMRAPAGGWPPPWNGIVPLTDNVDANADHLVVGKPGLWHLDRKTGVWTSRSGGGNESPCLALVGTALWSISALGEVSATDILTGAREVKFSHRRKGGRSPLEGCAPYTVKMLRRLDPDQVLMHVEYQLPGYPGDSQREGLFLVNASDKSVRDLLRGRPTCVSGSSILGFNPDWLPSVSKDSPPVFVVDSVTGVQSALLSPRNGSVATGEAKVVWSVPEDLRLPYFTDAIQSYYDGGRLMFFGGTSVRLGSRYMLWVFDKGQATGRPIPLANLGAYAQSEEYPQLNIVYTPRGIVLSTVIGFGCIPMEDVSRYLAKHSR